MSKDFVALLVYVYVLKRKHQLNGGVRRTRLLCICFGLAVAFGNDNQRNVKMCCQRSSTLYVYLGLMWSLCFMLPVDIGVARGGAVGAESWLRLCLWRCQVCIFTLVEMLLLCFSLFLFCLMICLWQNVAS